MRQVRRLEILSDQYYRSFEIGQCAFNNPQTELQRKTLITSIEDNSMEFPDSLNFVYTVKCNNVIFFSIENCRCIVEYEVDNTDEKN